LGLESLQDGRLVACILATGRCVHRHDDGIWIGYLDEFPDYLTQGESILELEENLRDLYRDLTSGEIPGFGESRNYCSDEKGGLT